MKRFLPSNCRGCFRSAWPVSASPGTAPTNTTEFSTTTAFPFSRIKVVIGQPYTLPHVEGHLAREVLHSMTEELMERIAVLLPPSYRGMYGGPAAGHAQTHE